MIHPPIRDVHLQIKYDLKYRPLPNSAPPNAMPSDAAPSNVAPLNATPYDVAPPNARSTRQATVASWWIDPTAVQRFKNEVVQLLSATGPSPLSELLLRHQSHFKQAEPLASPFVQGLPNQGLKTFLETISELELVPWVDAPEPGAFIVLLAPGIVSPLIPLPVRTRNQQTVPEVVGEPIPPLARGVPVFPSKSTSRSGLLPMTLDPTHQSTVRAPPPLASPDMHFLAPGKRFPTSMKQHSNDQQRHPAAADGTSLVVYLANALELSRHDVVDAAFACSVKVFDFSIREVPLNTPLLLSTLQVLK